MHTTPLVIAQFSGMITAMLLQQGFHFPIKTFLDHVRVLVYYGIAKYTCDTAGGRKAHLRYRARLDGVAHHSDQSQLECSSSLHPHRLLQVSSFLERTSTDGYK